MRYVAAYLLAQLGGKEQPSEDDIKKILGSVGIEPESDKLQKVMKELKGKNIEELIAAGKEKLASVPTAAVAAPGGGGGGGGGGGAAADGGDKKEEKKAAKEESDESDDDMGFGLFD